MSFVQPGIPGAGDTELATEEKQDAIIAAIEASGSSGGLTDDELRASPVPVAVEGSLEIANDIGSPIPQVDANKQSVLYYAEVLTANDTLIPSAGKSLKLVKIQVLQSPDNVTANRVTLSFTSIGDFFTGWVGSDSSEVIGAVDEVLDITLSTADPVSIMLRYKEV